MRSVAIILELSHDPTMTIAGLLLIATLITRLFPATPAARWLHLHLVELPLEVAAKLERRHIWFALILFLLLQAAVEIAPAADLMFAIAWDIATYVDIVAVVSVTAMLSRSRWLAGAVARRLPRLRRPAARARRPQPRRRELPANDDDGAGRAGLSRAA